MPNLKRLRLENCGLRDGKNENLLKGRWPLLESLEIGNILRII